MSVDWLKVETEYITTDISLRELADEHGVAFNTVCNQSKTNGWVRKRKEYKETLVAKVVQKTANKEADKLAKLQSCSDKLDNILEKFITATDNAEKGLSAMDLSFLTSSLKTAVAIKRDVYDVLTPAQKEKIQIDREKLEIEKQKVKAGEIDKNITVVLKGEIEEYAQ